MKNIIRIIICIFVPIFANAQKNMFPDYEKASFLYGEFSLKHDISGNVQALGTGFNFEFGFNFGKIINKKMNLNILCGMEQIWGSKLRNDFLIEYNRFYDGIDESGFAKDFPVGAAYIKEGYNPLANTSFHYGILLRLPGRYCPTLKFYNKYLVTTIVGGTETEDGDIVYFSPGQYFSRNGYGFETRINLYKLYYISFYYEWYDLKNAKIENTTFDELLFDDFFTSYSSKEKIFGIKVGINTLFSFKK